MRADFSPNLIDADWLGQVLESALAEIVENEWRVAADMVEQHSAHPDRAGRGCLLDASSQIDAVSDEIVAMNGHVREMDAKAHLQRFDVRPVDARQRCADLDRATQRIDRARELGQRRTLCGGLFVLHGRHYNAQARTSAFAVGGRVKEAAKRRSKYGLHVHGCRQ